MRGSSSNIAARAGGSQAIDGKDGLIGSAFRFRLSWSDPEASVFALKDAGIHALCLANNHMLDCGKTGLTETIGGLNAHGIAAFGAGGDLETAARPLVIRFTLGGAERSLVVFAGFEHRRRYERQFGWYARSGSPGVCELSPSRIGTAIAALRSRLPSPTFVAFPHWGADYAEVTDNQRTNAAALVDAGIDIIIGHGSHVAQAAEVIGGRPVIYGIGNLVWNTPGRYEKLKVEPFSLAATLVFGADGTHRLRLYPLLTDNGRTGFQSRLVDSAEFADAARLVSAMLEPKPKIGAHGAGRYLEIDMKLVGQGSPAPRTIASRRGVVLDNEEIAPVLSNGEVIGAHQ